ncbi:hypothetical protein VIMS_03850 [Mycobacterium marinum]|nr:hypothetical protein VIMS_03850 [Mycobacterium marinum]RFZ39517.1 hypothetical protein KST_02460 [Mycobacterium marinum]
MLTIWYSRALAENSDAMAVDTSSSAAASSPVVRASAAELAAPRVEPILVKSDAAAASMSGVAITYDIPCPLTPSVMRWGLRSR